MKRDESLPLILTKKTLSSNKKFNEAQNESLYTNESSFYLANLKRTMKLTKMRKSNSTQDLFLTQKSSIPNSQSTSFLFNGINPLERNTDYEKNKYNFLYEGSIYKLNYLDKFKKIKTELYKDKFYKGINFNTIKKEEENNVFDEGKKDNNMNDNDEENNKLKIDFNLNIWGNEINLKNHENYDLGGDDNDNEKDEITESNDIPEINNDSDINKESSEVNSQRMSLYLTEMKNYNNNSNETPFIFQSTKNKSINKNYIIKIDTKSRHKNPFNFTRYASIDNIYRFHKLYRDLKKHDNI